MPWTKSDVDEFKKGLTESQKEQWVEIANSVRKDCLDSGKDEETCDAKAIRQANGVVGEMSENRASTFKTFKICAHAKVGKVRTEHWNGRKWKVAPVVAVAEGVLKGKFLPGEEIKSTASLWEDSPLPVMHPEEAGMKTSARSLDVIEEDVIGRLYNVEVENKKLKGEIWVDIEKAEEKGGKYKQVLDMLENNEKLEVSTGFYSFPEPQSGKYEGEHYNMVHRNVIPDHLSLLPNAQGECSWADGCGAPRINSAGNYMNNKLEKIIANARSTARTPSYSGTSTGEWNAPSLGDFGFDSVTDMSGSEKTDIAKHSLLGESGADTFSELLVLPVVNANGNLNKNALSNAKARANQVSGISGDTVDSVKNRCTQLLEDEFSVEYETEKAENKFREFYNHLKKFFYRGEEIMKTDQLVAELAEELDTDEDKFEAFEDEGLENLGKKYGIIEMEEDELETNETDDTDNKEMDTEGKKSSGEDEEGVALKDKITTEAKEEIDDYLKKRKEKLETEDKRQELITNITEYDETIDEEGLEDAPVKVLKTMLSSLKPSDYSGVGGPRDIKDELDLEWLDNREERIRGEE